MNVLESRHLAPAAAALLLGKYPVGSSVGQSLEIAASGRGLR
jgi:hypothetical protein